MIESSQIGAKRAENAFWWPLTSNAEGKRLPKICDGSGIRVYDSSGRSWIDAISGAFNVCLGHGDKGLSEVVYKQLCGITHFSPMSATVEIVETAASRLATVEGSSGHRSVFFSLSGSEAVETALKIAFQYHAALSQPRFSVIALEGAYHGNTLGALSYCTRLPWDREFFAFGDPKSQVSIEFPVCKCHEDTSGRTCASSGCIGRWREFLESGEIAAVILEPILGVGGIRPLPEGFARSVQQLARKVGTLVISDEIMTGSGRTGTYFYPEIEYAPDIVLLSKCLSGGVPLSATITRSEIRDVLDQSALVGPLRHGQTYSGNAVGCAAALHVLDRIRDDGLLDNVSSLGMWLLEQFSGLKKRYSEIIAIRGRGLLLAIEFCNEKFCKDVKRNALSGGLIVARLGAAIAMAPAFIINHRECEEIVAVLAKAMESAREEGASAKWKTV